jgi:hypothetical protein
MTLTAAASTYDGKYVARTILLVFGSLGATLLGVVWSVIWLVTTGIEPWPSAGVMVAIILLFLTPVILFALLGNWTFEPSREGSRYLARAYAITGTVAVVSAATVIVYGVVTRPWTWVPVSSVIMGVAFFAIAVVLGRALRSATPPALPPPAGQAPGGIQLESWTPGPPPRTRLAIIVTGGVVVLVGALALLGLHPWAPFGDASFRRHYAFSSSIEVLSFGLIAAAIVALVFSIPVLNRPAKTIRRYFPLRKRVARAIAKGDSTALDPVALEAARRYAADSSVAGAWGVVVYSLLGLGISAQQLSLGLEPYSPFGPWVALAIFVLYVVVVIMWAVRWRRAVRFLRVNGEPTPQPAPELVPLAPVG